MKLLNFPDPSAMGLAASAHGAKVLREVLGKRADGYHEIRSVMQTVSLCDRLTFNPAPEVSIACDLPGWDPQVSLVGKAIALLKPRRIQAFPSAWRSASRWWGDWAETAAMPLPLYSD